MSSKKRVEKGLSSVQKMFASAIDWNAFDKAMSDEKSRKEIESILKKVKL